MLAVRVSGVGSFADEPRFGRYREAIEIARGGMGVILRAGDPELGRFVALKVIQRAHSSERRQVIRFVREARITGQLEHPNIMPIYELDLTPEGDLYFSMKLVRGRSLKDEIDELRELSDRVEVLRRRSRVLLEFLKVLDAVAFAHSRGVVHRDLKPANILIGEFGEVLVTDWGIAKLVGATEEFHPEDDPTAAPAPGLTRQGSMLGTLGYMPPEQAAGIVDQCDARSDVYSLGAVLYELLTLQIPHQGDRVQQVREDIIEGRLVPPSRRAPEAGVPAELEAIVLRAMALDPIDRYRSVGEMRSDLEAYLSLRLVSVARYTPIGRAAKWVRRNPAVSAVSAVAALLLAVFVGWLVVERRSAIENRDLAVERAALEAAARRRAESLERDVRDRATSDRDFLALVRLEAAAGDLWPAHPSRIEAMRRWLDAVGSLRPRRELHRARLLALQGRTGSAGEEERWELERQAELVAGLDRLPAAMDEVHSRIATALRVQVLQEERRGDWARAIRSIADLTECPRYDGLAVASQEGLVPLGRDRSSGLWEFLVLETGEPPGRVDGALRPTDESGIVLVLLPGGTFRMGVSRRPGDANHDPMAQPAESPAHDVALAPFFLAKYETTQSQWSRIAARNPSHYVAPLAPVEGVTWDESQATLRRLGLVLPTEAQWEYGARGGAGTPWWTGPDEASLEGAANLADRRLERSGGVARIAVVDWDDGYSTTAPVGRFRANAFGLHDVLGNVSEWCRDRLGDYSSPVAPGDGERVPGDRTDRVFRGGSFIDVPLTSRSGFRHAEPAQLRSGTVGIRPARALERPP